MNCKMSRMYMCICLAVKIWLENKILLLHQTTLNEMEIRALTADPAEWAGMFTCMPVINAEG